jgi:hypothetical protein
MRPIRVIAPIMATVIAAPYVAAPFRSDFDHRDAPESPPLSAIIVATSTDGYIVNTMTDEVIEVGHGLLINGPAKVI